MCVYDFLKENDFAPFPRHHIQDFARQLFGSVACEFCMIPSICSGSSVSLVLHDLRLIHTDLKPENILLVHNDYRVVNVPIPGKVGDPHSMSVCPLIGFPAKRCHQTKAHTPIDGHPFD